MHASRVLVPVSLRFAERASQTILISSPRTFTFVSPLIARSGPPAARGCGQERDIRPRDVPRARCVYLICVCDRV
jgi:hypothetical protein